MSRSYYGYGGTNNPKNSELQSPIIEIRIKISLAGHSSLFHQVREVDPFKPIDFPIFINWTSQFPF